MPDTTSQHHQAKYPGPNTINETIRLRAQHNIAVNAIGGLVLCSVDLSKEHFQALDSATADGYFLHALRKQLKHPESATLIGTDINDYPETPNDSPPGAVQLAKQNFREPWPAEWTGKFDFVHQRAAMVNAPTFNEAVDVVQRLVGLLKPGGWIQLVDGQIDTGEILADDPPFTKMWKHVSQLLVRSGCNPVQGSRIKDILAATKGVGNLGSKTGAAVLGKGCVPELEEDTNTQFWGLRDGLSAAMRTMPNPVVSAEEMEKLVDDALEEARTKGVKMVWHATWAQKAE